MSAEIISTIERRRPWPDEEKRRILSEALAPGSTIAAVADRNGVCRSLLYTWLRLAREGRLPGVSIHPSLAASFVPVRIEPCNSERIDRTLEQLELALEEAEATKGEIIASQSLQPEPELADAEAPSAETAKPEKKRRQLPPGFPRHDVIHRPPGVCKRGGGTDLRDVSESVPKSMSWQSGSTRSSRSCRARAISLVQSATPAHGGWR